MHHLGSRVLAVSGWWRHSKNGGMLRPGTTNTDTYLHVAVRAQRSGTQEACSAIMLHASRGRRSSGPVRFMAALPV